MSENESHFFGLLSDAPAVPSADFVAGLGWEPEQTLLFTDSRPTFDASIGVLARLHAWDDDSPLHWVVTTVGLSHLEQPFDEPLAVAGTFRRIELATVSNNITKSGPIPQALAVALADEPEGWDWDQVEVPPLMEWLFYTAQNLASMIARDGIVFRLGQFVRATGNPMPASRLLNALILPACPQMLGAGLEPRMNGQAVEVDDWWVGVDYEACDQGFVWLMPIDDDELDVVEQHGAGELLARFVEAADDAGHGDLFEVAFDLMRGSER